MPSRTTATMPHPTDDFRVNPRPVDAPRDPHPVLLRSYDSRTQGAVTLGEIAAQRSAASNAGVETFTMLRDCGGYLVLDVYASRQQLVDARQRQGMAPLPDVDAAPSREIAAECWDEVEAA